MAEFVAGAKVVNAATFVKEFTEATNDPEGDRIYLNDPDGDPLLGLNVELVQYRPGVPRSGKLPY